MYKKMFVIIMGLALALAFFVPSSTLAATKKPKSTKPVQKDYDYELADQQPSGIITMQPRELTRVWIEVKNTGTKTWKGDNGTDIVRLGSGSNLYGASNQKQDYTSELYDNDSWASPNRADSLSYGIRDSNLNIVVPPGYHTRFTTTLKAPATPGTYKAYFTPLVEGITWMKDIGIYWEITVVDNNNTSKTVYFDTNGETKKVNIGDGILINSPTTGIANYDRSIINFVLVEPPLCGTPVRPGCVVPPDFNYAFVAKNNGFTRFERGNFSVNIVVGRDYYSYDGGFQHPVLFNAKKGDIVIVYLPNPGDGGYSFNEPEFPAGRVKQIDYKRFYPEPGSPPGSTGSDQWVFEILDSENSNYIQIRASQPWANGDSFTALLLNMNPALPCASGTTGCAL